MSDEDVATLASIVGEVDEATLRALLQGSGGDVAAAANAFFDGTHLNSGGAPSLSSSQAAAPQVGEDVLGTLFKTLEDQGRKLAGARRASRPCRPHRTTRADA